jgi:hypothetical protein
VTAARGRPARSIAGRIYGTLTAVRFVEKVNTNSIWEFLCDCGEVEHRAITSVQTSTFPRCRECHERIKEARREKSRKAKARIESFLEAPREIVPVLDVERNREAYVRRKLAVVWNNGEMELFPKYTCGGCPYAPRCEEAFKPGTLGGECLRADLSGRKRT